MREKNENKQKEVEFGPFFKKKIRNKGHLDSNFLCKSCCEGF